MAANIKYEKYKIAMDRIEMLNKLNLSEKSKNRIEEKLFNWVENDKEKLENCPIKKYWWQENKIA